MTDVEIREVDERDSSWERSEPRFRVYLHGSGGSRTAGWTATYDVTGADVLQVIDWAQHQAGDALTYAVALVWDDHSRSDPAHARGLVWLVGMDGNDTAASGRGAEVQERMLGRRRDPVGVPEQDRMPAGVPSVGADLIEQLNRSQPPS